MHRCQRRLSSSLAILLWIFNFDKSMVLFLALVCNLIIARQSSEVFGQTTTAHCYIVELLGGQDAMC